MKSTPIYIQRLQVENIKTFVDSTELLFTKADGTLSQWTLILGDNGIGKSTLMQLIAWMKPKPRFSEHDFSEPENYVAGPIMDDEENYTLEHLVHRSPDKNQRAVIEATFSANQKLEYESETAPFLCTTGFTIILDKAGKLHDFDSVCDTQHEDIFLTQGIELYAYSASRRLGKSNINDENLRDTIQSFIQDRTELYDAEELLHALNYARLDAKSEKGRQRYYDFIEKVKEMLVELLPDFNSTDNFEINAPKILEIEAEDGIVVTTRHGYKIPFEDLSLGYRSVAAWAIDLAWRLFQKHPKSKNPLQEPAIVLVDEIDLHLHPKWQREIMGKLSKHFKRVQFIASAHSPLMVQAAINSNFAVLHFDEERKCVIINNEPTDIAGWRVDQILTSELFDLKSARGATYDRLLAQREALLRKKSLTAKEKVQLADVTKQLTEMPTGETPAEMEDREAIADMARRIREGQVVIKL